MRLTNSQSLAIFQGTTLATVAISLFAMGFAATTRGGSLGFAALALAVMWFWGTMICLIVSMEN